VAFLLCFILGVSLESVAQALPVLLPCAVLLALVVPDRLFVLEKLDMYVIEQSGVSCKKDHDISHNVAHDVEKMNWIVLEERMRDNLAFGKEHVPTAVIERNRLLPKAERGFAHADTYDALEMRALHKISRNIVYI